MKDKIETEIHITCADLFRQGQYPDHETVRQELGNKFDDDVIAKHHKTWITNMEELSQIWSICNIPKQLYPILSDLWDYAVEISERNNESELMELQRKVWEYQDETHSYREEIQHLKSELSEIKAR